MTQIKKITLGILIIILGSCNFKIPKKNQLEVLSLNGDLSINYSKNSKIARQIFFDFLDRDTSLFDFRDDFYRIDIGNLLNDNTRYAVLLYFTSDTTGKLLINKETNKGWKEMFAQEIEIFKNLNDFKFLRYEDFTGDEINEILIPYNLAPSHQNFNYYCFKLESNKFQSISGFKELTRPEFDKKNQVIHTLHGGGIGNYISSEYKLKTGSLSEVKQIISTSSPSDKSEDGFIQIIETFVVSSNDKKIIKTDTIIGLNEKLPPFWKSYFDNYVGD